MNDYLAQQPFNLGNFPSLAAGARPQPFDLLGSAAQVLTLRELTSRQRAPNGGNFYRPESMARGWPATPPEMDRTALDRMRGMAILGDLFGSRNPFGVR